LSNKRLLLQFKVSDGVDFGDIGASRETKSYGYFRGGQTTVHHRTGEGRDESAAWRGFEKPPEWELGVGVNSTANQNDIGTSRAKVEFTCIVGFFCGATAKYVCTGNVTINCLAGRRRYN